MKLFDFKIIENEYRNVLDSNRGTKLAKNLKIQKSYFTMDTVET